MGSMKDGDQDARDAMAWIESGMPDEKAGHGPDAPKLMPEQLGELEFASYTPQPKRELVEVGRTSRGHTLYREPNGAGGHRYWSDSIGGGVMIYDTCLSSVEELELALKIEKEFENGQR